MFAMYYTRNVSSSWCFGHFKRKCDQLFQIPCPIAQNAVVSLTSRTVFVVARIKTFRGIKETRADESSGTLCEPLRVTGMAQRKFIVLDGVVDAYPAEFNTVENYHGKKYKKQEKANFTNPVYQKNGREGPLTAVAIKITNSVVSWAKMSDKGHLLNWNVISIPNEPKKCHLTTLYEMVLHIAEFLPKADLYIMEELTKPKQLSEATFMANMFLVQIRAMLLIYLNEVHVPKEEFGTHKVYFLRPRLAARLSSTLVGGEQVSVQNVVADILNMSGNRETVHYSPVTADENFKYIYESKDDLEKEMMGQALLLIMTFMELVIHKRTEIMKNIR